MPSYRQRVKLHTDPIPLFSRYQIERQIASAFNRTVKLPSGGAIVIDPTEALVSIDINSSRATKGADIEETAMTTNLEAAEEVARQLRLRDMGGLIVIDFIDMSSTENQRAVEDKMRTAVRADRARVQIGRISQFGLMQMSRQRLRPSLEELTTEVCPRCSGQGRIQDIKSLALAILRIVEEESLKERSTRVRTLVPLNVASYLLNEKRQEVTDIERRTKTHIVIVPNVNMETPQYDVQCLRDDGDGADFDAPSYELTDFGGASEADVPTAHEPPPRPADKAAVQALPPTTPAPDPAKKPARENGEPSLLRRFWGSLFSEPRPALAPKEAAKEGDGRNRRRQRRGAGKASGQPAAKKRADKPNGQAPEKDGGKRPKAAKARRDSRGDGRKGRPSAEGKKGDDKKSKRKDRSPKGRGAGKQPAQDVPAAKEALQEDAKPRHDKDTQPNKDEPVGAGGPVHQPAVERPAHRPPSEDTLAQSKRRPRRGPQQGGRAGPPTDDAARRRRGQDRNGRPPQPRRRTNLQASSKPGGVAPRCRSRAAGAGGTVSRCRSRPTNAHPFVQGNGCSAAGGGGAKGNSGRRPDGRRFHAGGLRRPAQPPKPRSRRAKPRLRRRQPTSSKRPTLPPPLGAQGPGTIPGKCVGGNCRRNEAAHRHRRSSPAPVRRGPRRRASVHSLADMDNGPPRKRPAGGPGFAVEGAPLASRDGGGCSIAGARHDRKHSLGLGFLASGEAEQMTKLHRRANPSSWPAPIVALACPVLHMLGLEPRAARRGALALRPALRSNPASHLHLRLGNGKRQGLGNPGPAQPDETRLRPFPGQRAGAKRGRPRRYPGDNRQPPGRHPRWP